MRRIAIITLGIGSGLLSIFIGLYFLSAYNFNKQQTFLSQCEECEDFQEAENLILSGNAQEALSLIHDHLSEMDEDSENFRNWSSLLLTASMAVHDISQLMILFEYYPETFIGHDDAALYLAQEYLEEQLFQNYELLRNYWRGFEKDEEAWFSLDVDRLIREGKQEAAIQLLNSRTFVGDADINRMHWLAQLTMQDDPKESWNLLTKAAKKDPLNPETRFLKGKLLESIGEEDAAIKEYLGSVEIDPHNTYLQDYLGTLLVKQKDFSKALRFWTENLTIKSDDQTWLKLLFWKQVAKPTQLLSEPPKGNSALQQYNQYLFALNQGQFWKHEMFNQLLFSRDLLKTEQSTFWLKLLDALKNNKLQESAHVLKQNPFYRSSWDRDLEDALTHLLTYLGHISQEINSETLNFSLLNLDNKEDYFAVLASLAKHSQPGYPTIETTDELDTFLRSKDAIAAIFLRCGWNEAANQLYPYNSPCKFAPDWIPLGMISVLTENVSLSKAINFASTLPLTQQLSDHAMQLIKETDNSEHEITTLYQLAKQNSTGGYQLANFLSQIFLSHDQDEEAEKIIMNQKRLQHSTQGQEMLARIAIHQGDLDLAKRIYSAIENDSIEAKSFQAKRAFEEKNWVRAKELTEELLILYPDNATLKNNLDTLTNLT